MNVGGRWRIRTIYTVEGKDANARGCRFRDVVDVDNLRSGCVRLILYVFFCFLSMLFRSLV